MRVGQLFTVPMEQQRFYGSSFFFWICKKHIKLFAGTLCHLADGIAFSLITLIEYACLYLLSTHCVCCGENMYLASLPFLGVLVFINNCVYA
jgi:hypothetical protein